MENNEELTQNPIVTEEVENEQITAKAPKKVLDANEKKKIVKLIQPSILPSKVRIEVNTLVAEIVAETAPVADEVMPEMEDVPEPDEEEMVEDNTDLDGLNKLQLVEMLEELVQDSDVQNIKDKVAAIRLHFNKLNKEDMDNEPVARLRVSNTLKTPSNSVSMWHLASSRPTAPSKTRIWRSRRWRTWPKSKPSLKS